MLDSVKCFIINSLCCLLYRREYKSYMGIKDMEKLQKSKLLQILEGNKNCEYGVRYDFKSIKDTQEYRHRLPLTTYEDYRGYVERIEKGEKKVLTEERVLLLELTSGSASASKLIPYTQSLKEEFQKGIKPWVFNLYTGYRGIKWGRSYWSVTPATAQNRYSEGGIPIGFEEDSQYFGALEKRLFDSIFAVPGAVAKESNMDEFYHKTALNLLRCENLTLISVWNPTFLMLLLEYMEKNSEKLVAEISKKSRKRGRQVQEALDKKAYLGLWKRLKVISCWCDANAAKHSEKLRALFPQVTIQPKGLLATEGFISFPLAGERAARLSANSHFFEFRSVKDGKLYLAHELQKGRQYSVIITTSGGLYRYMLKDVIEVVGFEGAFPLMTFKGKEDKVSDMYGEKLNEAFVRDVMEQSGTEPDFYMLAPEADRYVLYVKGDKMPKDMDEALRRSFHYDYCRKLGQLKELRIYRLTGNPKQEYLEECVRRGQRLGDIKPVALHLQGDWDKAFKGEYI